VDRQRDGDWLPPDPPIVEQAAEPAETRAISRSHQWAEHVSAVLLLGLVAGGLATLLLWWIFG
jgi:hypothetical protein